MDLQTIMDQGVSLGVQYLPKVLLAIITLIIGFKISNWLGKLIVKVMKKKKVEATVRSFLSAIVVIMFKVLVVISVASMIGIATTSFIAVLGAAGLAIGLALQGSLANFAGGVLIAMFKPFVVGDFIDAQGYQGVVEKVSIFNTVLKTTDNQKVIIPNGPLSNGPIKNVTANPTRRVDMVFGIGYDDDIKKAQSVMLDIISKTKNVLKDPAPVVRVSELADSSVNFVVRPWTKTENYWGVFFDIQEAVKTRFDREGISIPYPQSDVHMHQS